MTDFDPEELSRFVEEALKEPRVATPDAAVIFGLRDTRLLSVLDEVFSKWMPRPELNSALGELRDKLFVDHVPSDIRELHTIMRNVRSSDKAQLPHWNLQNPQVVLVSDTPAYKDATDALVKSLVEAGFSSDHCAWTFVHRTNKPVDLEKWIPFLFHELRIWAPALIVTLGGTVAELLLGKPLKLADSHGAVWWTGPWAILPTFSPGWVAKAGKQDLLTQDLRIAHDFVYG